MGTKRLALLELTRILKFPDSIFYGQGANQQITVFSEEPDLFIQWGYQWFSHPQPFSKNVNDGHLSVPPFLDRHIRHASLSICCVPNTHSLTAG